MPKKSSNQVSHIGDRIHEKFQKKIVKDSTGPVTCSSLLDVISESMLYFFDQYAFMKENACIGSSSLKISCYERKKEEDEDDPDVDIIPIKISYRDGEISYSYKKDIENTFIRMFNSKKIYKVTIVHSIGMKFYVTGFVF
jgi:hypothetical protein